MQNEQFIWITCDLSKPDTFIETVKQINEPHISLLISNAGVAFKELATQATRKSFDKMFSINVVAPLYSRPFIKRKNYTSYNYQYLISF